MALLLLTLILNAIDSAHALIHPPHQTTDAEGANAFALSNGWTPKPTPAPYHHGIGISNQYAAMPHDMLFRRASVSVSTCGYLDADADYPLTCAPGSTCVFYGVSPLAFDCCANSLTNSLSLLQTDCPYISTCLDYGAASNTYTGSVEAILGTAPTLSCGSASPSCFTIGNLLSGSTYYYYGCTSSSASYAAAAVPTITSSYGQSSSPSGSSQNSNPPSSPPLQHPSTNPGASRGTTQSSSPIPKPSTSSSSSSGDGASGSSSNNNSNKPSTNVGAIAGGTVGGVAAVALIAVAGFLVYRKRKQRVDAMPEVSQYDPGHGGPGNGPSYAGTSAYGAGGPGYGDGSVHGGGSNYGGGPSSYGGGSNYGGGASSYGGGAPSYGGGQGYGYGGNPGYSTGPGHNY